MNRKDRNGYVFTKRLAIFAFLEKSTVLSILFPFKKKHNKGPFFNLHSLIYAHLRMKKTLDFFRYNIFNSVLLNKGLLKHIFIKK